MANLKLTDRQEKSTFSNEDYIHVVSGGTSFKQKLSALSSEFGQTAGSTTGTILYTGVGLNYDVSSSSQYINSTNYNNFVFETFTLSDGDVTHDRIDAFVVELIPSGTISANQIQLAVIEGTPSASPEFPQIDLTTQSLIGYKTVVAGATSDTETVVTSIFNENIGSAGGEWDIDVEENIDSAYTINPYSGSLSIQVGNSGTIIGGVATETRFTLVSPTDVNYRSSDTLNFAILTDYSTSMSIQIKLIDSVSGDYYLKSLTGSNWNEFGLSPLNTTEGGYRLAQISLAAFATTSTVGTYDTVEFTFSGTSVMQIDQIKLQSNVSISNSGSTSSLPYRLISGTISQVGGDDPVFTEGYNDSGIEVNFVRNNSTSMKWQIPGISLPKHKINVQIGQSAASQAIYTLVDDGGEITIKTPSNGSLSDNPLEIKLYI